jgi:hypothetical protein
MTAAQRIRPKAQIRTRTYIQWPCTRILSGRAPAMCWCYATRTSTTRSPPVSFVIQCTLLCWTICSTPVSITDEPLPSNLWVPLCWSMCSTPVSTTDSPLPSRLWVPLWWTISITTVSATGAPLPSQMWVLLCWTIFITHVSTTVMNHITPLSNTVMNYSSRCLFHYSEPFLGHLQVIQMNHVCNT